MSWMRRDVTMMPKGGAWFYFQMCLLEHAKAMQSGIPNILLHSLHASSQNLFFWHLPWIDTLSHLKRKKSYNKTKTQTKISTAKLKADGNPVIEVCPLGDWKTFFNHFSAEKVAEKESWPSDRVTLPSAGFVFAKRFLFDDCASTVTDVLKGSFRVRQHKLETDSRKS